MANIAFDIDNTLYKVIDDGPINPNLPYSLHRYHQVIDIDMMNLLYWYDNNGDNVFIWSGGGLHYVNDWKHNNLDVSRLKHTVHALSKQENRNPDGTFFIDICYDDREVNLAKVNILVKRENHDAD